MFGFGGHFSTKSRRYSTTLRARRQARGDRRRTRLHDAGPDRDERDQAAGDDTETIVLANCLTFAGIGRHTTADALLANTTAARAREHRLVAREELTTARPTWETA
jgi:hypothetical protein